MKKKKSRKGSIALSIGAVILSMAGAVGGTFAYMSSIEGSGNVFLIGDVHIKTTEPKFPTTDANGDGVPDDNEKMVPYQTEPKNPLIQNTGKNDAIVFMKVTVPAEQVTLFNDDGTRNDVALTDIFWLKQDEDSDDSHQNHFDENWIELTTIDSQVVDNADCNDEGKGREYIFGYHVRLDSYEKTTSLFDKVQNKKYGSQTINPEEIENITIDSYAIQADDIYRDGAAMDTTGELTEDQLTYIYQVFVNQNKENIR